MEQQRQQQQMAHQHPLQHQHSHRSLQSPPQAHSQTIQQNQNQMSHHPHLQQHFQNQQNPQSHDQFPNQQMHHLHSHTQHGGNPILARSNTFPMENQSCQEYEHSDQHPQQQQIQHDHQQQQYCVGSPVMTTSKNFQQHHYQPQQQQQQLQNYHQVSNYQQNSTNYHHSQNVQAYNDRNYGAAPPTPPVVMGPRSKCDQVIFEAMTKACEIAVRGRCTDLVDASMNLPRGFGGIGGGMHGHGHGIAGGNDARKTRGSPYPSSYSSSSPGGQQQRNGAANTANGNGSNSSLGSTSSRFNIEVEEVEEVRVVLQRWKQSLNVPLRLDIYYEHDSCYDEDLNCDIKDGGGENFAERSQKPPQRELLERWCIDYVPSYHQQMGITNDKSSNIAQLRQVCKRIVVLLRSLHCLTRILPAYRLKSLLLLHASNGSTVVNGGISAGNNGIGVSDGWGSIGYSIYVSDYEPEAPALPSPAFTRQSFPNVPTPHGTLCMSVMYDATLHPNHMVADLAERRAQWIQRRWIAQRSGHTVTQEYMEVGNATGTMPIPIQGRQYSEPVVTSNGFPQREFTNNERRHFGSCPPATMIGGGAQYNPNTNSLGKSPAVSDFIIQDYHGDRSPSLKPASSPGVGGIVHTMNDTEDGNAVGDKRVMSGLSLAMMANDENSSKNGGHRPSHPSTPEELPENQDVSILRWQPSATRAAFHHPPPTYTDSPLEEDDAAPNLTDSQLQQAHSSGTDRTALNLMKQGTHFFHSHSGYGYGYNGSQVSLMSETSNGEGTAPIRIESVGTRTSSNNSAGDYGLSISPSPLMSTPPQTMWMKSRPPPATSKLNNDKSNGCADTDKESTSYSSQGIAPPFQNPTSLQPLPSPSSTHCGSTSTTAHTTAHGDPDGGINSQHKHSGLGKSSDVHKKRSSSSSSVLLPPVTSLDLLQKSPFSAARMHGAKSSMNGGDKDLADDRRLEDDDLMMPFMLGSYRDDGFTSSIPRMVSASSRGRSGSSGGSMTGIGGSISLMPSLDGGYSHSGGYYSTYYSSGPGANMEPTSTLLEEMPFAVDDDPLMSGASSPFGSVGKSSRSLLNGPNAFDGSNSHGVAEITSSLAVSSLHHRCGDEGKPRLKLFGSAHTMQSRGLSMLNKDGSDEVAENAENDQMQDFASIKDQLSDFRNFAGSLMVGSVHDSRSE